MSASVWVLRSAGNMFSFRVRQRSLFVIATLGAIVACFALLFLTVGSYQLGLHGLWKALTLKADIYAQVVVFDVRLPRLLSAICVGALLAMSGAVFQSLFRNPLASPDILGFNAGAASGALASILFGGGTTYLVGSAIAGGLAAAALVLWLSWQNGLILNRMILMGLCVGFALVALSDLLMSKLDIELASEAAKWLIGSLASVSPAQMWLAIGATVVFFPAAWFLQMWLDALQLDDDVATSLGLQLKALRLANVILGVSMAAIGVAVAGPLPFVAFIGGPLAQRLLRTASYSMGASALLGAFIVLVSDFLSRNDYLFLHLPTGVFTAFIGAPYLIWHLKKQSRGPLS
ncbi:FecCD family ABC transporter permease [Polycladidibacter hongkongensis]|uniref:FecCD family ABC transporter permease n=1 Tax=Polycladidibacter hongkongensis TaxID=1647556 RepID=UPI00082C843B|nr:iron chelate uptake ABC transporter family permease subunit [Pseudovibrio hongkongensis]